MMVCKRDQFLQCIQMYHSLLMLYEQLLLHEDSLCDLINKDSSHPISQYCLIWQAFIFIKDMNIINKYMYSFSDKRIQFEE